MFELGRDSLPAIVFVPRIEILFLDPKFRVINAMVKMYQ